MNIQIKATNISLTPEIESYLRKRLSKADRFLNEERGSELTRVELSKTTNHHRSGDLFRAETTLELKGKSLFAYAEEEDLYPAIDRMQAEIIREIVSHKGRRQSLFLRGASRIKKMLRFGKGDEA